jgi:hypothetical protein
MINTTYIYFLHKGDNIPFYIGKSVNPDLRKAINEAKAKNAYFIKLLDGYLEKRNVSNQIDEDEELAFLLLEEIEKRTNNKL